MLDEFRSTKITWDKATSRIYSPVTANASDENGRKLVVQIVNGGQVEDLTGATLHLYWETRDKLHDGLDVFKAVDLEKGEFELSYTTGMLSNHGVLNANLVLIDTVGRVVSERFKITVTEGIDNDAIQSENSFSSLTQALIDVSNFEQNYAPRLDDLTAQLAQIATQNSNKKLKFIACAIRNTGSGFQLINDAEHNPIGVTSVTNDTDKIILNYDFTAKEVISLVVTPDEIMAKNGIIVGSSVGTSLSNIHVYKMMAINGYITKSGGSNPVYTVDQSLSRGVASATQFGTDVMNVNHDLCDIPNLYVANVNSRLADMECYVSSYGTNTTRVKFKRKSKSAGGTVSYNGTVFGLTNAVGIQSAVWDSPTNSLIVTFKDSYKNLVPQVSLKTDTNLKAKIYSYDLSNVVQIRFYDSANTLITAPSTEMKVIISAIDPGGTDVVPDDGVYLFEKTAFGKVNPNNLTYPGSNFWIYGVMEVE